MCFDRAEEMGSGIRRNEEQIENREVEDETSSEDESITDESDENEEPPTQNIEDRVEDRVEELERSYADLRNIVNALNEEIDRFLDNYRS